MMELTANAVPAWPWRWALRATAAAVMIMQPNIVGAVSEGAPASRASLLAGSARATAMGTITTVLSDGPTAIWGNPASVGSENALQLDYTRFKLIEGHQNGLPLSTYNFTTPRTPWFENVAAGLGVTHLSYGESQIISETGEVLDTFDPYDILVNLALAYRMDHGSSFGAAFEYTYSRLSPQVTELNIEDGTGTAASVTLGYRFAPALRIPSNVFNDRTGDAVITIRPIIAASLQHLGTKIKYNDQNQAESLPRFFHAGAGVAFDAQAVAPNEEYDWRRIMQLGFQFGYEVERSLIVWNNIHHYGVEVTLGGIFSWRHGFVREEDGGVIGRTKGWGLRSGDLFPVGFSYDYAEQPLPGGDLSHSDRFRKRKEWRVYFDTKRIPVFR